MTLVWIVAYFWAQVVLSALITWLGRAKPFLRIKSHFNDTINTLFYNYPNLFVTQASLNDIKKKGREMIPNLNCNSSCHFVVSIRNNWVSYLSAHGRYEIPGQRKQFATWIGTLQINCQEVEHAFSLRPKKGILQNDIELLTACHPLTRSQLLHGGSPSWWKGK